MTIADKAVDAAIHCEMKKVAYRQSKDGIIISFVLHPQEVPAALSTSHIGARYIAALVEIGDDEQPISPAEKEIKTNPVLHPATSRPAPAGTKRDKLDWRDVQPAAQAGIRANDPIFWAFLSENYDRGEIKHGIEAASLIRDICGVNSRVEFGTRHAARMLWHQLDDKFLAWKETERVG